MRYYILETLGEGNEDYCYTNKGFKNMYFSEIKSALPLEEGDYPGQEEATVKLSDDYPGLVPASLLGNSHSLMIVKKEVIDFLRDFETGEMEEFPITLINHRGRVHSKDYLVLNPLGTKDYLNKELSDILYSEKNGNIIRIRKYALDKEKLKEAPDLFRVPEGTTKYFFSERLVEAIKKAGFTNFKFREIKQG